MSHCSCPYLAQALSLAKLSSGVHESMHLLLGGQEFVMLSGMIMVCASM